MVSVVLVCWKRLDRFEEIVKKWLQEEEVSEVIVWDNSGSFKTSLPVILINSQTNINPSIRYAIVSMCSNNIVIHCDDDVIPRQGITKDFLSHFDEESFLGVEGVFFNGDSYFDQKRIISTDLKSVSHVDMVIGYLTMCHKNNFLSIDYSDFCKYQLEMDLQIKSPNLKRLVIPTNKYEVMDCSKDINALHLQEAGKKPKEDLYKKYKMRSKRYL